MNFEEIEKRIMEFVKETLKNEKVHGFDHTLRVYKLALKIASNYGKEVDLRVLRLAALLHDVGRPYELKEGRHHALISAEIARKILKEYGFDNDFIEKVVHAILAHSFSLRVTPRSLEAKILSDADKLDAMGAIGIARCFMLSGARGRSLEASINHFHEKLLKLKDLMWTEVAKRIAIDRHNFMLIFLRKLSEELNES